MLSTTSRQRAETCIRRAVPDGQNAWEALDHYRRRGGRIGWQDWFRLWRTTMLPLAPGEVVDFPSNFFEVRGPVLLRESA